MKKTLLVVALLVFGSLALFAQDFTRSNGVPSYVSAVRQDSSAHHITPDLPATGVKIYSNLGTKTDAFDWTDGWLIAGPSSPLGTQQWIGFSFTPTQNHTATQIKAAMFYFDGFGTAGHIFNFGIWRDANGIPGKKIHGRDRKNLPTWTGQQSDCCATQSVSIKPVSLKAGTPYWVVMSTDSTGTDSVGAWDFVWNDATGTQAYNLGSGWSTEDVQISAFAVYGTN